MKRPTPASPALTILPKRSSVSFVSASNGHIQPFLGSSPAHAMRAAKARRNSSHKRNRAFRFGLAILHEEAVVIDIVYDIRRIFDHAGEALRINKRYGERFVQRVIIPIHFR